MESCFLKLLSTLQQHNRWDWVQRADEAEWACWIIESFFLLVRSVHRIGCNSSIHSVRIHSIIHSSNPCINSIVHPFAYYMHWLCHSFIHSMRINIIHSITHSFNPCVHTFTLLNQCSGMMNGKVYHHRIDGKIKQRKSEITKASREYTQ